ncbi:MAG: DUF4340 domain-containing protein [Burkholderiales bacterium]|nr:DUF4340 domain-containing protein [Burkholderiales bacterium]
MTAPRPRRKVVAVWAVLFILVGIIIAVQLADRSAERADATYEAQGGDRSRMVVPVLMADIGAVEIAHAGALHRFERDPAGLWLHHGPHAPTAEPAQGHQADPVLAEKIAKAFGGLGRAKFERDFPFDPKGQDYGVLNPATLVLLYRKGEQQPLVQYAIGDMAPDGVSRYVLKIGASQVDTLPEYHVQNLVSLVQAMTEPAGALGTTLGGVRSLTGAPMEGPSK